MKKDELEDKYKERLKKIIAKKIETTMIYPLSQFELAFGELWGNGLPEDKLMDDERIMRKKWEEVRQRILDCGNRQARNAKAEIEMHDVHWNRYRTTLIPVSNTMDKNFNNEEN